MSTCNRLVSTDYAQNSPLISVPLSDFSPAKTSFSATHWHSSEMTEKSYVHQQSSMCYQYPAFKCSCLYLKCTYSLTQLRRTYATFFEVWILSRTNKTTESSKNIKSTNNTGKCTYYWNTCIKGRVRSASGPQFIKWEHCMYTHKVRGATKYTWLQIFNVLS